MSAKRIDRNQPEIVAALRDVGCLVEHTHMIGHGVPDLVVAGRNGLVWLEVKDGTRRPSEQRLTPDEARWHERWQGYVVTVNSVDQALAAVGIETE